ncbi:hypothetical protein UT300012_24470 [Paraclostridium bifermentans]
MLNKTMNFKPNNMFLNADFNRITRLIFREFEEEEETNAVTIGSCITIINKKLEYALNIHEYGNLVITIDGMKEDMAVNFINYLMYRVLNCFKQVIPEFEYLNDSINTKTIVILSESGDVMGTVDNEEIANYMLEKKAISKWFAVNHYTTKTLPKTSPYPPKEIYLGNNIRFNGYKFGERFAEDNFKDITEEDSIIIHLPEESVNVSISFVKGLMSKLNTSKVEFKGNINTVDKFIKYNRY